MSTRFVPAVAWSGYLPRTPPLSCERSYSSRISLSRSATTDFFFILFLLCRRCQASANYPNPSSALAMSNESQMRLHCMANGDLPVLVQGMAGIGAGGCGRIEEHSRSILKSYSVLLEIRRFLARISLECHPNHGSAEWQPGRRAAVRMAVLRPNQAFAAARLSGPSKSELCCYYAPKVLCPGNRQERYRWCRPAHLIWCAYSSEIIWKTAASSTLGERSAGARVSYARLQRFLR